MSYNVYPTAVFKKCFNKLNKKYPSLKSDLQKLITLLKERPNSGTPLGYGIYKVRISITYKSKGKSGGARVITYLVTEDNEVYLVFIYDKSQLDTISKERIFDMLKKAGLIK